jgi:hypothetical protein
MAHESTTRANVILLVESFALDEIVGQQRENQRAKNHRFEREFSKRERVWKRKTARNYYQR